MSNHVKHLTTVPALSRPDSEKLEIKKLSPEELSKLHPVVRLILTILSVAMTILSFWVLLKEVLTPRTQ